MQYNEIKSIAKDIVKHSNTKDKDALHLASAIYNGCNYFITCDDKFIRTVIRNRSVLGNIIGVIKLYNPIDFLIRRWTLMLLNKKLKFTDKEIIEKGSRILIKELGYSGFLRFIRQTENTSKEDYLKIGEEVFEKMSVDDIFDKAEEHWKNRK